MIQYKVVKNISKREYSWFDNDIKPGTILYQYEGDASRFVMSDEIAVTFSKNSNDYFTVPRNCVKFIKEV
jgi:hypothetical protein